MRKRLFDFLFAAAFLVVFSPIMLVSAVLVLYHMGWPVFFTQPRPGMHGKVFRIIKFRTMRNATDSRGQPLSDAQRMTPFGAFLRRTSMDEFPSFINVFKGDMSVVGPRPLLVKYMPLYSLRQARRHEVRPGMTGWAQINGRNALSWEERFEMDVWYVENQSFKLDMQIIRGTSEKVFGQDKVSAAGRVTMPEFTGAPMGQGAPLHA